LLQASANTRSLSKRDAVAFVRAVRRYGLQTRLSVVASEAGGAVEAAEPQAQQLLWGELVQGCRRALEVAAEQDKQQGQLHDPRVSPAELLLLFALSCFAVSARLSATRTSIVNVVLVVQPANEFVFVSCEGYHD
jgi:chromodomain-helicase-DNA-binding protein 1